MQNHVLSQPLPEEVQQKIWVFVREKIAQFEDRAGAKVAEFQIRFSASGQIDVEVLATESENDAAIDLGLEETGLKGPVNRLDARERLAENLKKPT